jgi:hypothetical protein
VILPPILNDRFVATQTEAGISGIGRLLPHSLLRTCHSGRINRTGTPMGIVDPKPTFMSGCSC